MPVTGINSNSIDNVCLILDIRSTSEWQNRVKNSLSNLEITPAELISLLKENEQLRECYRKSAGVFEGFTVEEHTLMVLETAQRYRESFQVEPLVTWNEFLLFLALHDIGKGLSTENKNVLFSSSLSLKKDELGLTQDILKSVMQEVGIDPQKISIFSSMLTFDSQGLYLRGHIHQDEAFDNIVEMACNAGIPPLSFYTLFEAFHRIDAASYPSLFSSIFEEKEGKLVHNLENQKAIDTLSNRLENIEKGEASFQELLKRVTNRDVEGARSFFDANIGHLNTYLEKTHKEMLFKESQDPTDIQRYRTIKRGFRDFLLLVAENEKDLKKVHVEYREFQMEAFGRTDYVFPQKNIFRDIFTENKNSRECAPFFHFFDELMNFRKDYLCRYSVEKVEKFINSEISKLHQEPLKTNSLSVNREVNAFIQEVLTTEKKDVTRLILSLLKITIIHGADGAIWPNLIITGMQLVPSGRLFAAGVVPLSGELQEGAGATGINKFKISGTSLDDGTRAIEYATDAKFYSYKEKEKNKILNFIKYYLKAPPLRLVYDIPHVYHPGDLMPITAAILRLRAIYPESFAQLKNDLKATIDHLKANLNQFKTTQEYKYNMPVDLDPDGSLGYLGAKGERYWANAIYTAEDCLKRLQNALTDPISIPENFSEFLENHYPLVFASTTLHPYAPKQASERCAQKAALLGKDIQTIFTTSQNREKTEKFLREQHVEAAVRDLEELDDAITVNRIASPYLADIASAKKIAQLKDNSSNSTDITKRRKNRGAS